MNIEINLPFAIYAQGRQRYKTIIDKMTNSFRSWNYMPQKSKDMQLSISYIAQNYMKRYNLEPIHDACELFWRVCFPIPLSWSKKQKKAALEGTKKHIYKPDSDNIEKLIRDSLNKICYVDDSLIWKHGGEKIYGEDESTLIVLTA